MLASAAVGLFVVATLESWAWMAYSWRVLPLQMWWFLDNGGSNGLLPENVGAVLVRSASYLVGLAMTVAVSVLIVRHRRTLNTFRLTVALMCLAVAIGITPWASSALFQGTNGLTHRDALQDFRTLRPGLDRVVEWFADNGEQGYSVELPATLGFVSVTGTVDVAGSEQAGTLTIFVPQWARLVDDAGGYFYSPAASPAGYDMRGMACEDPTPIEDGWWTCGMA
ncbi:hypothetical protein C8K30_102143 [Promicromonospora sp. AC04]|nr:hypothetical protein C8K30_102143 [Promicromonospora sp. AC04]